MQATESPFAPSARTLRQFAGLWVLFFGLLACQAAFRSDHPTVALALAGLAVTVEPLGLVKPAAFRPVFLAWMGLAYPTGWVVSHLLLGALFYGLFTPLGWLFRLIGRDALCRRPQVGEMTYWTAKPVAADPSQYFRQF